MTHAGPFPLRRYHADVVCFGEDFPEDQKALGVNTVVVGKKNQHEIAQSNRKISPTSTDSLKRAALLKAGRRKPGTQSLISGFCREKGWLRQLCWWRGRRKPR